MLIYRYKIWAITKTQEETIETKGMRFLRSVGGCTRKERIRSNGIREELNFLNLNARMIKSTSQWKYYLQ
jgi:hypothetical protein